MIKQQGFILIIVLIFLFVITLLVVSGSQEIIINHKMQAQMQQELALFTRAEAGMQQMVLSIQGQSFTLPDSSLSLQVTKKIINTDQCGNQTIDLQSISAHRNDRVILNSEDIFAKVPPVMGCAKIPTHQRLWFKEE